MKFVFVLFATVLAASAAQAALPPTAESLRRFTAITQSSDVYDVLGAVNEVTSINSLGNGNYEVVTATCVLEVTVVPKITEPPQMVPPLEVTVGKSTCLP